MLLRKRNDDVTPAPVLACIVTVMACGASPGSSGGPVGAAVFCTRVAETLCVSQDSCCTMATRQWPTQADCVRSLTGSCGGLQVDPTDARLAYDPAAGGSLIERIRTAVSTCGPLAIGWGDLRSIAEGSVDVGGSCSVWGLPGEALVCRRGTGCDLSGTCQPVAVQGGACSLFTMCGDGLACASGVCGPLQPDGSQCGQPGWASVCQSGYCYGSTSAAPTVTTLMCI